MANFTCDFRQRINFQNFIIKLSAVVNEYICHVSVPLTLYKLMHYLSEGHLA